MYGEPKTRDGEPGYYSAAVIDADGNSIEAVYRPNNGPDIFETGSVFSKTSSRASSANRSSMSRATTAVERGAPSVAPSAAPSITRRYTSQVDSQDEKSDSGNNNQTAKTIVGSLIGAAAGAAIAYAWSGSGESQSQQESERMPAQHAPREWAALPAPSSKAPSRVDDSRSYSGRAIEPSRPGLARSATSKSPRTATIYEGSEYTPSEKPGSVYMDDNGRRASDGSVFSSLKDLDMPLRAIEYSPSMFPGKPRSSAGSIIDPSRAVDNDDRRSSVYSSSTAKPSSRAGSHYSSARSKAPSVASSFARTRPEDPELSVASFNSSRSGASGARSSASAARDIIPEGSVASLSSSSSRKPKSSASARHVPLPESVVGVNVDTNVTPDDSISQIDVKSSYTAPRSHAAPRSHHSKAESRSSRRSSRFDEPVRPDDSISQISCNSSKSSQSSQRTVKGPSSRVSRR